jgi:transcription initiation factor TFIIIB Brf1 subunit/transcription initiation factor TFIIB
MKRLEKTLATKNNQQNQNNHYNQRNNKHVLQNQFVRRYCDNLHMLTVHTDEVMKVSNNIEKLNIATEHNPYSLAAATILLVAEVHKLKNINKKKIAAEFNISEVTITKAYKKLEEYKNTIIDTNKTNTVFNTMENEEEIPDEIKQKMKEFGVVVLA